MNDATPIDPNAAAIEVEQAVIGYLLADANAARQIVAELSEEDFGEMLHREAFAVVKAGFAKGREHPGRELIVATLGNANVNDDLKLREYLIRATNAVVLDAKGRWHDAVEQLREIAARRQLANLGKSLAAGRGDLGEMLDEAREHVDALVMRRRKGKAAGYSVSAAGRTAIDSVKLPETAITTGYEDLDRVVKWARGELSVVAARPGMGKSALATGVAIRVARTGLPVLMFSLEMHKVQLGSRILCDLAYQSANPIPYQAMLQKEITPHQERMLEAAQETLKGLPLRFEEQRGLTVAEIQARTRKAVTDSERAGKRLGMILVDHIGLVTPSNRYAGTRHREVAEISNGLATLAKDLDIAVVALSQLNRGVEGRDNKRPSLADLRDSGAIEEDASAVLFLYRPAYYLERELDDANEEMARRDEYEARKHILEVIVAKNRNGRTGSVPLFVDIGSNALRNYGYARR